MKTTKDVIVIGGGVIGLAIAIDLKLRGADVTVISRDRKQAASQAAAGMLAPMAEKIENSAMLDLCLRSRWLYSEWVQKLESISNLKADYLPCGILAPVLNPANLNKPTLDSLNQESSKAVWLDDRSIHYYQSGLSDAVVGGWWYPEDGQVDNRSLMKSLLRVVEVLGIDLKEGIAVQAMQNRADKITSVFTSHGEFQASQYVLATGSWSSQLLPIPVRPVKGQMLCLQMPHENGQPYPLQKVLYGENIYLVPRQDGRLIVGATVEEVGWAPHNNPSGIQSLFQKAMQLLPAVAGWSIQDFWWGFRPGTADELPILGQSAYQNLYLANGHYRNGILLAPITAHLIGNLLFDGQSDSILANFSWQRFLPAQSSIDRSLSSEQANAEQKLKNIPDQNTIHKNHNMILLNGFFNRNGKDSNHKDLTNGSNVADPQSTSIPKNNQTQSILKISESSPIQANLPVINLDREDQPLVIAGKSFNSRLMTGTGKYSSLKSMQQSISASGCDIVTVAVRRVQSKAKGHEGLAEAIDWKRIWMLPNTAGCKTAEEAVRVARLGREMAKLLGQEDNNFVKLEVIPDPKYLLPDPIGTLEAAEQLVKEGFAVLPYINADPLLAKRLEEAGCATVMPLGSPIGSGQGIKNTANIAIIIEQSNIPVVVDAGIGTPSEAALAMEMGADALLINSAIAMAQKSSVMAQAMNLATVAGRLAYLSGRIPVKQYAAASSPLVGNIGTSA